MYDPDAPDPLDRPGPRPWCERTRREQAGILLGFGAIAGSLALIVIADTPAFRFGVATVALMAAGWFVLRAWMATAKAGHRVGEGRPIAAAFSALVAATNLGLGSVVLWYAAQIVFV